MTITVPDDYINQLFLLFVDGGWQAIKKQLKGWEKK